MVISNMEYYRSSVAWSPCSQFVATQAQGAVEIKDPLTFELLSTLQPTEPIPQFKGPLAYSPDGCFLACNSGATIIIWDIQTGGVVKEIQRNVAYSNSLIWSLDGGSISTLVWDYRSETWIVYWYDVASSTELSLIRLQSSSQPYLWAFEKSFQVITMLWSVDCTINIFKVGAIATKVKSFHVQVSYQNKYWIGSFSPTTYCISLGSNNHLELFILNTQNLASILNEEGNFQSHCFSSNGSLFAAYIFGDLDNLDYVHMWKFSSGHYTLWRKVSSQSSTQPNLLFSPASSAILGHFDHTLQLWHLDDSSISFAIHNQSFTTISYLHPYIATAYKGGSTVTITNLLLKMPLQFIDLDIKITEVGFTGNVLLVMGSGIDDSRVIIAWLLTEGGLVNNIQNNRRADRNSSIWTIPVLPQYGPDTIKFSLIPSAPIAVISSRRLILFAYNIGTGESIPDKIGYPSRDNLSLSSLRELEPLDIGHSQWSLQPHNYPTPQFTLEEGWIIDVKGRYQLWLPVQWRVMADRRGLFRNTATIRLMSQENETIIIKLY